MSGHKVACCSVLLDNCASCLFAIFEVIFSLNFWRTLLNQYKYSVNLNYIQMTHIILPLLYKTMHFFNKIIFLLELFFNSSLKSPKFFISGSELFLEAEIILVWLHVYLSIYFLFRSRSYCCDIYKHGFRLLSKYTANWKILCPRSFHYFSGKYQ